MNKYTKMAKESVGLGVTSMAGGFALGSMAGIPGMPSQASNIESAGMAGLQLANIGNLARIGMNIMPGDSRKTKKQKNLW
jgi:hypothetical protein